MVTVSSAFISSRRERIRLRVSSAPGAFGTAAVDVLRVLGKTDLDNTDVVRDHFLSLYRERRILTPEDYITHVGLTVSIFQWFRGITCMDYVFQLPSGFRNRVEDRLSFIPVRNTQAGARRLASWLASAWAIR